MTFMDMIGLPLQITRNGFRRDDDINSAITSFLRLLLTNSVGGCVSDMDFGFLFNNLAFRNFNENDGVVIGEVGDLGKKISGSSRNLNTFASELKEAVCRYETRLEDVSVTMTYSRKERKIFVTIGGKVSVTGEPYKYETIIKVWN